MLRKTVLLCLCTVFIFQIISFLLAPVAEAQDGDREEGFLGWIDKNKFLVSVIFIFVMGIAAQILTFLMKDRLIKPLLGKYVNIKLRDGKTYRGILRVELKGIEIISEKARLEGKGGSYFLEGVSPNNGVAAYIRYHDEMAERELAERSKELEKAYHPGPLSILYRKFRNVYGFMKSAFDNVFRQLYSRYVTSRIYKQQFYKEVEKLEQTTEQQLDAKTDQVEGLKEMEGKLKAAYLGDFDYNPTLERMIGTMVQLDKKVKEVADPKQVIFADYTKNFCSFMDVKYIADFSVTIKNDDKSQPAEDRELKVTRQDDGFFMESNLPYPVQITKIEFKDKDNKLQQEMKERNETELKKGLKKVFPVIQPYGQVPVPFDQWSPKTPLGPFGDVTVTKHKTLGWTDYVSQTIHFSEERMADVVFHRTVATPTSRVEKYEPLRMKLGAMTESFLSGEGEEQKELLIVDENNKPIPGIQFYHGYITNVDQDRIDPKEIDINYNRRWSVEHYYNVLEKKLRPIKASRITAPGIKRRRMIGQTILAGKLQADKLVRDSISQTLYTPVARRRLSKKTPLVLPIKVLAFMGNFSGTEFPVLRRFEHMRGHRILYEQTSDMSLPRLERAHVLWIGQGEIFHDGYRLTINTGVKIKNFVSRGGIVITSGQYLTHTARRRHATGWIPERLVGIDRPETREFDPSINCGDLFKVPNKIEPGEVIIGDAWTDWTNNFTVLATANGSGDAAALLLKHGKGIYLVTGFRNESESDVETNARMMENLLHYSVEWLDAQKRTEFAVA